MNKELIALDHYKLTATVDRWQNDYIVQFNWWTPEFGDRSQQFQLNEQEYCKLQELFNARKS